MSGKIWYYHIVCSAAKYVDERFPSNYKENAKERTLDLLTELKKKNPNDRELLLRCQQYKEAIGERVEQSSTGKSNKISI